MLGSGMRRFEMEPVPLREPKHCQQKHVDEEDSNTW
jgi:hypothetical protein